MFLICVLYIITVTVYSRRRCSSLIGNVQSHRVISLIAIHYDHTLPVHDKYRQYDFTLIHDVTSFIYLMF